jgi:hypothetical protein
LYISPTTEPHENEKANKAGKKTETQFQQPNIAHQGDPQSITILTKLVNTESVSKNAMTKEIRKTKSQQFKKSKIKELTSKIARAASQFSKDQLLSSTARASTPTSTSPTSTSAKQTASTCSSVSAANKPQLTITSTSTTKIGTNRFILKLAFQQWKRATAIDKHNFNSVIAASQLLKDQNKTFKQLTPIVSAASISTTAVSISTEEAPTITTTAVISKATT